MGVTTLTGLCGIIETIFGLSAKLRPMPAVSDFWLSH